MAPKTIPEDVLRRGLEATTGEPAILESDIHWDLRSPCADCPFLNTSPFHEGVASSIESLVPSIESHNFAHTCHKTDTRDSCDGPVRGKETGRPVQHCAGATMMLLKTGHYLDCQLPLMRAMDAGKISGEAVREMTERANRDPRVFTLTGFLRFYGEELGKRCKGENLRRRRRELARRLARRKVRHG